MISTRPSWQQTASGGRALSPSMGVSSPLKSAAVVCSSIELLSFEFAAAATRWRTGRVTAATFFAAARSLTTME